VLAIGTTSTRALESAYWAGAKLLLRGVDSLDEEVCAAALTCPPLGSVRVRSGGNGV
jgi:hypothetical protein